MIEEQIQYLPVDAIECRPQVREVFDEEFITGLARSLRETDRILQPLRVRRADGKYFMLDGEQRLRAAKKAGFAKVPVIIEDKEMCEAEVVHRQLIIDCQRVQLTPVERAKAFHRLMEDSGWSNAELAVRVGISPASVTKTVSILELPKSLQDQVARGALGMSSAYAIASAKDETTKAELVKEAAGGRLTRKRAVEQKRAKKNKRRNASNQRPVVKRKSCVELPISEYCSLAVSSQKTTLEMITAQLMEFLERLANVDPKSMELTEVAKLLIERSRNTSKNRP